jgi:hypothetical protein
MAMSVDFHSAQMWSSAMATSAAATNRRYEVEVDVIDEALRRSESTFRSPRTPMTLTRWKA